MTIKLTDADSWLEPCPVGTGSHCWHLVQPPIAATNIASSVCCWCGKTSAEWFATTGPERHGEHLPAAMDVTIDFTWRD